MKQGSVLHRPGLLAVVASLCAAAIAFLFYAHTNAFPATYHPDEPSKVDQILTGKRNFNHPQLLLTLTDHVHRMLWREAEPNVVLRTGREVSAALAAVTVFCGMLLGYSHRKWVGLIVVGLAVGCCPTLFAAAHFFKEDAALLAGLSICLLGARGGWPVR